MNIVGVITGVLMALICEGLIIFCGFKILDRD